MTKNLNNQKQQSARHIFSQNTENFGKNPQFLVYLHLPILLFLLTLSIIFGYIKLIQKTMNMNKITENSSFSIQQLLEDQLLFIDEQEQYNRCFNQTSPGEQDQSQLPFYQKSNCKQVGIHDVSFQSEFINQHLATFTNSYQNYIEFILQYSSMQQKQIIAFQAKLNHPKSPKKCHQLINSNSKDGSNCNFEKIMLQLDQYDKLAIFLNIVCEYCLQDIALQLISVASLIVSRFEAIGGQTMMIGELISQSIKFSTEIIIFTIPRLRMQSGSLMECIQQQKLKQFLKIYACTIMLVTAQYFQNPFYSEQEIQNHKTTLILSNDDGDNLIEHSPIKRIKSSD